ncbi:MAG TPA: Dabb family protein [Opitutaceae bacterium]|nr:Dabb family protein [Opitutaceae bacterium]
MKKLLLPLLAAALLPLAAAAADTAPKSVIHIVTVAWKDDAKPEQIQAAIDGVKALPGSYPGITRVWVKTLKVQNPRELTVPKTHVLVMEFKDEQALKDYSNSDAQKKWYEAYTPIRKQSTTHDVTN